MNVACGKGNLQVIQWLYDHGASEDVTQANKDGFTPMYCACENNNPNIAQWLYNHGGSQDVMRVRLDTGLTPLYIALQKKSMDVFKWICSTFNWSMVVQSMETSCQHVSSQVHKR